VKSTRFPTLLLLSATTVYAASAWVACSSSPDVAASPDATVDAAPAEAEATDSGKIPTGLGQDGGGPAVQLDAAVVPGDGGKLAFSGGVLVSGAQLPAESPAVPAFRCNEGSNGTCINMRKYWPTPATGQMQVKMWEFASNDALKLSGKAVYRSQGYFPVSVAGAIEYRLIDHFSGPNWTTTLQLGAPALETWIDTWSLRYDGDTVVEFKDDANFNTTLGEPRSTGVRFGRSTYDTGRELRWGSRMVGGVDNSSPTYTNTVVFPTASLTGGVPSRHYADNTFGLVEVRNGVIVGGVSYDTVALVKVSQRSCADGTECRAVPAETTSWIVDYFYMAPDVGMIARFAYVPATKADGSLDLTAAGGFQFATDYVELMTDVCTKPAPARTTYDWEFAFADGTLTKSPPAPLCP
jgi:hypothetical protein